MSAQCKGNQKKFTIQQISFALVRDTLIFRMGKGIIEPLILDLLWVLNRVKGFMGFSGFIQIPEYGMIVKRN